MNNKIIFATCILLTALLAHSIYRDIQLEKQFPGDLRNRVVGSRLQKDGKLPYTYSMDMGGGMRYFDGSNHNKNGAGASNITASPFFHELLYPICDLPQRTISILWMWLQYVLLAFMIWMFVSIAPDKRTQWIIICAGILFTATEAWKDHISSGQLYLFEGFLMAVICFLTVRNKKYDLLFAGLLSAMFVLIRPFGIVIFLPMLFYCKKFLPLLSVAFGGLLIYGLFIMTDPFERALYQNYITGMKFHVKYHQWQPGDHVEPLKPPGKVQMINVEGFDCTQVMQNTHAHPFKVYGESSNIFVLYRLITHRVLSVNALAALSLLTTILLVLLFFYENRGISVQPGHLIIFCFTLYMIAELFTPIHRHQYNTVQWFPLVLLAIVFLDTRNKICFLLLIAGLLLNISNTSWLPMRHTVGEFCWLAAMLTMIFHRPISGLVQ